MFATRAGCRLYYDVVGDARDTLVLVRGLARSSTWWGPMLPLLAPHFRLVVLDNRGVGRSDAPWPPYTTREMADDVAAVMDAAGVERAHVFGMSMGGMIVQHLALAHPERIDRLVIGCSTPGGPRSAPTPRLALLRTVASGRLDDILAAPGMREGWREIRRDEPQPARGFVGQLLAVLRHDAYDRIGAITHPTLVITGDDDALVPPDNSRLLASRIPHAKLVMLAGARHDFPADRPTETAREILHFLTAG